MKRFKWKTSNAFIRSILISHTIGLKSLTPFDGFWLIFDIRGGYRGGGKRLRPTSPNLNGSGAFNPIALFLSRRALRDSIAGKLINTRHYGGHINIYVYLKMCYNV